MKVKLLKSCVWFLPSSCVGVFPPPSFMYSLLSSSSIFLFYVSAYLFLSARPNPPFSPALPDLRQSKVLVSVSVSSPDLFHVVLRYANRVGSDVLGRVSVIEDGRWSYYCGNCECWMGLFFFFFFFSHPLSLVPVLEKKELFLIPLIPRVLLFSCVWWLVVVNDCRWRLISSVFSHLPGHRSVQSSGI